MVEIKSPEEYKISADPVIFMGGGITGVDDWQEIFKNLMADDSIVLVNPRQDNYQNDEESAKRQIDWEHRQFNKILESPNGGVIFWFLPPTLCPITLFELGFYLHSENLFVGCDPNYTRSFDVQEQINLKRPGIEIVDSLENLANQVRRWIVNVNA